MIDAIRTLLIPRKQRLKLQRQAAYVHYHEADKRGDDRAKGERLPALKAATIAALRAGA